MNRPHYVGDSVKQIVSWHVPCLQENLDALDRVGNDRKGERAPVSISHSVEPGALVDEPLDKLEIVCLARRHQQSVPHLIGRIYIVNQLNEHAGKLRISRDKRILNGLDAIWNCADFDTLVKKPERSAAGS
jgi:hypothetical protein